MVGSERNEAVIVERCFQQFAQKSYRHEQETFGIKAHQRMHRKWHN